MLVGCGVPAARSGVGLPAGVKERAAGAEAVAAAGAEVVTAAGVGDPVRAELALPAAVAIVCGVCFGPVTAGAVEVVYGVAVVTPLAVRFFPPP